MATPPDSAHNNPYAASEDMARVAEPSQRSQLGTLAAVFSLIWSVILGLAVAVVVYAATFTVTCLGTFAVEETNKTVLENEFVKRYLRVVIFGFPCITAFAAFVFTLRVKFRRAMRQKP